MAALTMIADAGEPMPVAELARGLGLPRSSASRLMSALRDGGLVEQDSRTRRYVSGPLAWRLGVRHRPLGYDGDLVAGALAEISTATGFTTWMAVLNGVDVVLLRQHQGRTPVQFSVRLGQSLPAHATAVGKALLSRLPDAAIARLYDEKLDPMTPHTIVTRGRLLAELRAIRKRGISVSDQEAFPGVISIGGAVYGPASNCPLGLSVSFPERAGDLDRVSALVLEAMTRIGRELGDDYWRRP